MFQVCFEGVGDIDAVLDGSLRFGRDHHICSVLPVIYGPGPILVGAFYGPFRDPKPEAYLGRRTWRHRALEPDPPGNFLARLTKVSIMTDHTWRESIEAEGEHLIKKIEQIIAEGNVRRIEIIHNDQVIAAFPLTVGVVGALIAPVLTSVGAIAAVLTDCKIEVERIGEKV